MGNEFAQLQEWSEERELDWFLLKEERHQGMQNFVKARFTCIRNTAVSMSWMTAGMASSGSMQMTAIEAFSVS